MDDRIIIVSEKRDNFYDLTELISEFMEVENKTEEYAINYFMENLEGTRYRKFPVGTSATEISRWIMKDTGLYDAKIIPFKRKV